jgi:hypothetical protein
MVDSDEPRPHRARQPSAAEFVEAVIEVAKTGSHPLLPEAEARRALDDEPGPRHSSSISEAPEMKWIERRIGRGVLWLLKGVGAAALVVIGSALGAFVWAWLTTRR